MEYTIKTKFEIGDSAFGFVEGEIHNVIVDRIEINFVRFNKDESNRHTKYDVTYLATTTDCEKFNHQYRFKEGTLFTEEEIKNYINNYFNDRNDKG